MRSVYCLSGTGMIKFILQNDINIELLYWEGFFNGHVHGKTGDEKKEAGR